MLHSVCIVFTTGLPRVFALVQNVNNIFEIKSQILIEVTNRLYIRVVRHTVAWGHTLMNYIENMIR